MNAHYVSSSPRTSPDRSVRSARVLKGLCSPKRIRPAVFFGDVVALVMALGICSSRIEAIDFSVESNSHAALGYFWVNDPSCPKSILLEVLEHFLGPPQDEAPAAPLPPRGWLDEMKDIGCAILLVAFLIGLCFLLNAFLH